jgi:hypothetical protein
MQKMGRVHAVRESTKEKPGSLLWIHGLDVSPTLSSKRHRDSAWTIPITVSLIQRREGVPERITFYPPALNC